MLVLKSVPFLPGKLGWKGNVVLVEGGLTSIARGESSSGRPSSSSDRGCMETGSASPEHPENYNVDRLLAPVAICSLGLTLGRNWVPLVVIVSRSWGSILMWVLGTIISSFEL